ncbi:MAG TPA: TetR/AcrR family transcriptional regulator [Rhizomicrobium sp.]|nr:TetR/AcrR family transcriptional regulator [Rhizomicrobium sp.]
MPRVLTETDISGFREKLCERATKLFVERGAENFNMRLLASEMGVSAMTPYRYFRDKDEILSLIRARAFTRLADRLEQALATTGALPERSAAVVRAYVRFALEEQACYRLIFDFAEPKNLAAPELAGAETRARAAMTAHLHMMVDQGYYKGDPELIGHVFWASLHGVVVLYLADKLDGDFESVVNEMCRVLKDAYRVKTTVLS